MRKSAAELAGQIPVKVNEQAAAANSAWKDSLMLYVDIPTAADLIALAAQRADICASLYLHTSPVTQRTEADRIELKNLAKEGDVPAAARRPR